MAHRVHNNANSSLFFYTSLIFTSDVMLVVKIELRFITFLTTVCLYMKIFCQRGKVYNQCIHIKTEICLLQFTEGDQ